MKHTLLPPFERKIVKREYITRLVIVFCFMVSLTLIVGVLMLLPSVYRAKNEETRVARIAVSAGKKDGSDVAQAKAGLAADADLLSKLTNPSASITASEAIKMIASVRGVSKITSFSIDTHDPHMISASIQGNAPSRDELLALKGRLMQVTPGGSVDFPISELTSNTDIDFSISIKWPIK